MALRRGGVIPWFFAGGGGGGGGLEIKCLISYQHFTGCKYGSVISQLRVLASHKTNFESVAQRRLGITRVTIWEVPFFE